MERKKIPIENIYYMLAYAWDFLDEADEREVGKEQFDHIYELFHYLYVKEVRRLIRCGLLRSYKGMTEETGQVRGKINVTRTLQEQTLRRKKVICHPDSFSEDHPFNQIVKATLILFMRMPKLTEKQRKELYQLLYYFSNVSTILLQEVVFHRLQFHSLNRGYRLLINISQLIVERCIVTEERGKVHFRYFVEEELVAHVFEKFVMRFYKHHLPVHTYSVSAPHISWQLSNKPSNDALKLLPTMRTDIVIENKEKQVVQIIDTKFYVNTLVRRYQSSEPKLHSQHLYQLFAYVHNTTYSGKVIGMLLYPEVNRSLDAHYEIMGKKLSVVTLNLHSDWRDIKAQLHSFVV